MAKQYIMKGLDAAFWQRVKEMALRRQVTVKDLIVHLLNVELTKEQTSR